MARDPGGVRALAGSARDLGELTARQSVCRACPRLVAWREEVADVRRRSFADETYWGRPIAGWGEEAPRVLLVGLAPAAHGGNRTGRVFTGDRSGDWLFASLYRTGPAVEERVTCLPWLTRELELVAGSVRVVVALGGYAWQAVWPALKAAGYTLPRARPPFGHGAEAAISYGGSPVRLLGCYHPSQQNTFTGRVTETMLDAVFTRAGELAGTTGRGE